MKQCQRGGRFGGKKGFFERKEEKSFDMV